MVNIIAAIKDFYHDHTKAIWITLVACLIIVIIIVVIFIRKKDPVVAGVAAASEATVATGLSDTDASNVIEDAGKAATEIAKAPPEEAKLLAEEAAAVAQNTVIAAENGAATDKEVAEAFVIARACEEAYKTKSKY
jgi:hypothetical protein